MMVFSGIVNAHHVDRRIVGVVLDEDCFDV